MPKDQHASSVSVLDQLQALHSSLADQHAALAHLQPDGITAFAAQALKLAQELSALRDAGDKELESAPAVRLLQACKAQCLVNQQHLKLLSDLCRHSLDEPASDNPGYAPAGTENDAPALPRRASQLLARA